MSATRMSVDLLLEQARVEDTGSTRRLALNIRNASLELDAILTFNRNKRRIGDLRKELHNLEVRQGVTAKTTPEVATIVDYDPAEVRAWARTNEWAAPERGRYLPLDLLDAWRARPQGI